VTKGLILTTVRKLIPFFSSYDIGPISVPLTGTSQTRRPSPLTFGFLAIAATSLALANTAFLAFGEAFSGSKAVQPSVNR
jgi:hypothetical protein